MQTIIIQALVSFLIQHKNIRKYMYKQITKHAQNQKHFQDKQKIHAWN